MKAVLCFRLLSQLNEKEREYQELLRNSVQRKQEQIDALRKAAVTEGNTFCNRSVCYIHVEFPLVGQVRENKILKKKKIYIYIYR